VNEMLLHRLDLIDFFLGKIDEDKPVFTEALLNGPEGRASVSNDSNAMGEVHSATLQ